MNLSPLPRFFIGFPKTIVRMNLPSHAIDRQLRFKGKLLKLLFNPATEKGFRTFVNVSNWATNFLKGRSIRGLDCRQEFIPRPDGSALRVRVYSPRQSTGDLPALLWLHGGGYALGVPEMSSRIIQRFIAESPCVVVAPDYRRSSEAPYPAALEDGYSALVWMKQQAGRLGIRPNQLIVGGDSAGGGLTAALSLYARDLGAVRIAFQMPLYPMIDDTMRHESARQNEDPVWNSNKNRWAWKLYLRSLSGNDVPAYAAPARARDYRNLPPTVTFVGDLEPFHDETVHYVENLKNAGVPVSFAVFTGCYHGFDSLVPQARVSQQATRFLMDAYRYAVTHYFAAQHDE